MSKISNSRRVFELEEQLALTQGQPILSRRDLGKAAAAGGAAVMLAACGVAGEEDGTGGGGGDLLDPSTLDGISEHDLEAVDADQLESSTPACGETPDNPLGPFYKAGAPVRNVILGPVQVGVAGTLSRINDDRREHLPNVLIDIWHAVPGVPELYDMRGWTGRARVRTNERGEYWFRTVLPPKYRDPNLGLRPRHIHVRVRSGGKRLVTQIYFRGDDRLGPDPFDVARLIVPFTSKDFIIDGRQTKILVGTFNIVL